MKHVWYFAFGNIEWILSLMTVSPSEMESRTSDTPRGQIRSTRMYRTRLRWNLLPVCPQRYRQLLPKPSLFVQARMSHPDTRTHIAQIMTAGGMPPPLL